jgi:murein hydrolase activator
MGWKGAALAGAIGAAMLAATALPAQEAPDLGEQQQRLVEAKRQSAAAQARSAQLEAQASAERDEAVRAQQQEGAVAARIQQAQADMAAAQARIAIVRRLLAGQRAQLATQQTPVVRLIAALQSLARRPAVVALIQPGSVDDLVHVRAVLGTVTPLVQARTADIRAELTRSRALDAAAAIAVKSLNDSRKRLEDERLQYTRLEAEHRLKSRALGRDAMFESDRAIGLGERARDIVDLMDQLGDAATVGAELDRLSGPLPRPAQAGEGSSVATLPWTRSTAPYRLPVLGKLVTGLGELSDAGVRSRGLTFETQPGATVIAPAAGRVIFAGRFRDYGMIVILDHGKGWTTLLSGLDTLAVRAGDRVPQGRPIGAAPKADAPRVTVELRRQDRPIDMTPLTG